ncbi:hypothetical protein ATM97_11410 [Nocardia sp. MH4]|jgi:hypothetical protein|uniref:hypothetical protein n=1 Tax=Nocardia TaxID=1817 RepID=UPI001C4F25FA|nr:MULTISPECIES: hypothetical protein [Nocardia]MBW0271361.1 hypothetical protein [Nocardia sp. MH4]
MGWTANGLLVEGAVDPTRLPGHPGGSGETVDLAQAFSRPVDYAVAEVDGWTSILDPHILVTFDDDVVLALAETRRALAYVAHSVSDVYGFTWYSGGQPIRRIIYSAGELADESGEVLPDEARLEAAIDEDFTFDIIAGLTGLGWGKIADATYRVWTA